MGFDRPNIHFSFKPKSDDIWTDLKPFTTLLQGSTIVYVLKKAVAEDIAKILRKHGVSCEIYHAGLSLAKRKTVLNDFTRDVVNVIVATVAFGMGIDKPDVRTIVHYGASKNIETYYQEVGRAGRDGGPSHAITYFDKSDFQLHEWFLNENHEHKSDSVIEHLRAIGQKMREFCYTARCRRKCLLEYFGANTAAMQPRKGCCDNCDRGSSSIRLSSQYENVDDNGFYDFTQNAHLLLRAIQVTGKSTLAAAVLRGSAEQKTLKFKNQREVYGAGKIWPKDYWTTLIQQLKCDGYLMVKSLPAPYRPITVISQKGYAWLDDQSSGPLVLKAIPEIFKFFVKKRQASSSCNNNLPIKVVVPVAPQPAEEEHAVEEADEDTSEYLLNNQMTDKHLEEILLAIRKELAKAHDVIPALVASEQAIEQMAAKKPISMMEFKAHLFDGFSLAKIEKFAAAFINAIVKFVVSILRRCVSYDNATESLDVEYMLLFSIMLHARKLYILLNSPDFRLILEPRPVHEQASQHVPIEEVPVPSHATRAAETLDAHREAPLARRHSANVHHNRCSADQRNGQFHATRLFDYQTPLVPLGSAE